MKSNVNNLHVYFLIKLAKFGLHFTVSRGFGTLALVNFEESSTAIAGIGTLRESSHGGGVFQLQEFFF